MAAGLLGPLALAAILVPFRAHFPNTDAALAMLLVVVAVAAAGNRQAGYLAALSAAVWFDFFLTRPYERFSINRQTDIETTVLLLVIGVAVTELAVWAGGSTRWPAAGRLPGRDQRHRRGGRRRGRAVGAHRGGVRPAHQGAVATVLPLAVRRGRARPPAQARA